MLIGVDEAGRGPIIGPMIVAALAVDDDGMLRDAKVRDSKQYSPAARERTFGWLRECTSFCAVTLSAVEIDTRRKKDTLNRIEVEAFASAVAGLYDKLSSKYESVLHMIRSSVIFVDSCDVKEARFRDDLALALVDHCPEADGTSATRNLISENILSRHKADSLFPVVSAASVVAKGLREEAMKAIRDEIGDDAGSGYPADPATRDFLERYYRDNGKFPPHTRLSWNTVGKIIGKISSRTLNDFM